MIIAVLRETVNRKSLAAARAPFFCRAVTKVYGKSARGNTWAYAPCVISSAEGGEGSPFCHPEQSEAKAKNLPFVILSRAKRMRRISLLSS